jgi:FtsZ-binding cell division protein ZapB
MRILLILLLLISSAVAQVQSDEAYNTDLPVTAHQEDMAADLQLYPTNENYLGVRYKAALLEDDLPNTGWVLLFGESGFTRRGEYQPHFIDLMIKAGWADVYHNFLCAAGFPQAEKRYRKFTIEFGLSDYEDVSWAGGVQDNDIAAFSHNPDLLPLKFTNIDSTSPDAPDKIMAEYQVDKGGFLEGREIEVSFVRAELTRLSKDVNYFMDPDNGCKPNSQADILYWRWIARLVVPSLGINASVSFYINAEQGEYLTGQNVLNFMWENPGRPAIETDRFRVIIFDPEVLTKSGWRKATIFLADYRTPLEHLPIDKDGHLLAGYRKVNYKGVPAIEASFGYGYTDYVTDGNPTDYEKSLFTKGVIDLSTPWGERNCEIMVLSNPGVEIYLNGELIGRSNSSGMLNIPSVLPGYHEIMAVDKNLGIFSQQLVYLAQGERKIVSLKEFQAMTTIGLLKSKYEELQNKYNELKENNEKLYASFNDLSAKYNSLNSSYVSLKARFEKLQKDYDDLRAISMAYGVFSVVIIAVLFALFYRARKPTQPKQGA